MKHVMRKAFKSITIATALLTSSTALAQWQGTWDTKYGEVKLQQSQMFVYGDYGSWGTIEATASADRRTLRGIYRRNDDGSWGYFEWYRTGSNAFSGRWAGPNNALPQWKSRGTTWTGTLKSTAKPALGVYTGGNNIGQFMGRAPDRFKQWYSDLYSSSQTQYARASQATVPKSDPLFARFPKLADYPSDAKPKWVELKLDAIDTSGDNNAIYGLMGIYAYCVDGTRSTRLPTYAGMKANVFDRPRSNPLKTRRSRSASLGGDAARKFPLDPNCLRSPDARIKIQLQTNLKEKNAIKDDVFGYRAINFFVDQVPSSRDDQYFDRITDGGSITISPDSSEISPMHFRISKNQGTIRKKLMNVYGSIRFTDR